MNSMNSMVCIPSNASTSTHGVSIALTKADPEHMQIFMSATGANVTLKCASFQFCVHESVLSKHSALFPLKNSPTVSSNRAIQIRSEVKKTTFIQILKCLYGYSVTVPRCDLHFVYEVAHQLQVEELLQICNSDFVNRFQEYDLFPLLKMVSEFNNSQITQLCFEQLQLQHFEPMRYNKSGLFICPVHVLKDVLKRHSSCKELYPRFGLKERQIEELVGEYCEINNLNELEKDRIFDSLKLSTETKSSLESAKELKVEVAMTPRKNRSSSQTFVRNFLSLPHEKKDQNSSFDAGKDAQLHRSSQGDSESDDMVSPMVPGELPHHSSFPVNTVKREVYSPSTKSRSVSRSRKESFGSISSLSEQGMLALIIDIHECEKVTEQSTADIQMNVNSIKRVMIQQSTQKEDKADRLRRMEKKLEQIQKNTEANAQKIKEMNCLLQKIEKTEKQSKAKKQFNQMFNDNHNNSGMSESKVFGSRDRQRTITSKKLPIRH